jgi:hypothetical protein
MSSQHPTATGSTRRTFLGTAVGAAIGAYVFPPSRHSEAAVPEVFDGSRFKLRAPEPHPKHGGVLRYGVVSAPPTLICINRARSRTWGHRGVCTTT